MQRFDLNSLRSAATARTYPIGTEELRDAIERVVGELPGWSLAGLSEGEIQAVRRTRLFGFEDDVSIRIWEMRASGISRNTRADFSSASRVGLWDLGQNGRNLRELVSAIDRKLIADH
jgi:uncharacterized protein (DUF1499 family)